MILADWAENALIAPQYARQSAYWASVLCEPEIPEFAEWPMEGARGFEFDIDDDADDAEADVPLLVPVLPATPAVVSLNTCKEELPAARAMANAATCAIAAEPLHHQGSIKGPFRVDWHSQMPLWGCLLTRASPNPTSGLPFPFRITSMSFTGWHGV